MLPTSLRTLVLIEIAARFARPSRDKRALLPLIRRLIIDIPNRCELRHCRPNCRHLKLAGARIMLMRPCEFGSKPGEGSASFQFKKEIPLYAPRCLSGRRTF